MRRLLLLAILAVGALAYGYRLGFPDFWGNHWESRRALIARTMLESGDWIVPRQNGEITLNKPPLYYWTMAAAMKATGDDGATAARLPSAVAGVAGLALTARTAALLGAGSTAPVAALLLLGNLLWFGHARTAEMDLLLAVVELAAAWAFLEARAGTRRRGFAWLGWIGVAAGFLLKGPVGVMVPVALVAAFIVADLRDPERPRGWLRPGWGLPLALALVLPWFAAVFLRVPDAWAVFGRETFTRYAGGLDHGEPFWFYGPVLLGGFLPGTLFLPLWIRDAARGRDARARTLRTLGIALVALVVFFSLSGSKRVYYLLPLWPWLAAGCAVALRGGGRTAWARIPVLVVAALLVAAAFAALAGPLVGAPPVYRLDGLAAVLLGAIALLAVTALVAARRGDGMAGLAGVTGALVLAGLFGVESVGPVSNAYRSRRAFLEEAAAEVPAGATLVTVRASNFANPFYMRRTIPDLPDLDALRARVRAAGSVYVLGGGTLVERLAGEGYAVEPVLEETWSPPGRPRRVRTLDLVRVTLPPPANPVD